MRLNLLIVVFAFSMAAGGAQPTPATDAITGCLPLTIEDAASFRPPDFKDYPASGELGRPPARVNLASHPLARRFRTRLRRGATEGPNFAGHYTIVSWGCGSACSQFAIVDAINGRVFFPPEVRVVSTTHVTEPTDAARHQLHRPWFRRDSVLFVVVGSPNEGLDEGVFYYRWTGASLKLVRFIRSDKTMCDPPAD